MRPFYIVYGVNLYKIDRAGPSVCPRSCWSDSDEISCWWGN